MTRSLRWPFCLGLVALTLGCPGNGPGGRNGSDITPLPPGLARVSPSPRPVAIASGLGNEPRPSQPPVARSPGINIGPFTDFPAPFPTDAQVVAPSPLFTGPAAKVGVSFEEEETKGWTLGAPLVRPRFGLAAVVVGGPPPEQAFGPGSSAGRLAVLEGENRPSMEVFDKGFGWSLADGYDQTQGVAVTADVRPIQKGRSRFSACVDDKDIWTTGADSMSIGGRGVRADAFIYRYSLDGQVGPCPVQGLLMPEPQIFAQAGGILQGKLVAAGGTINDLEATTTVQIMPLSQKGPNVVPFPPFADAQLGPAMPLGVAGAASVVLGGKLYVIGGYNLNASGKAIPQSAVQVFDGSTWRRDGQSDAPPALPLPLHSAAATAMGGTIYLAGGCPNAREVSSAVFAWKPGDSAWVAQPALPTPRALLALVAYEGKLLALGGIDKDGRALRTVEQWRP